MRKLIAGLSMFAFACTTARAESPKRKTVSLYPVQDEPVLVQKAQDERERVWFEAAQRAYAERAEAFAAAVAQNEAEAAVTAVRPPEPPKSAPKPIPRSTPAPPTQRMGGSTGGGSCSGGPISDTAVQNESGGDPGAVNPSSGAFGCWQLLPSTASSVCGIGPGSSIDQQRACAHKIYEQQGRGAWSVAG